MANRSYLYSLNESPRSITGISEWNYAIPISHMLLASGNPRLGHSRIWETEMPIAITADYEPGVKRFMAFLDLLLASDIENKEHFRKQVEEARVFLNDPQNRKSLILLEAGEVLDMHDEPLDEQAKNLLEEIKELAAEVDRLVSEKETDIFNKTGNYHIKDLLNTPDDLGLYWTNVLYFHFEDNLN